jgi:hypothetical protein
MRSLEELMESRPDSLEHVIDQLGLQRFVNNDNVFIAEYCKVLIVISAIVEIISNSV